MRNIFRFIYPLFLFFTTLAYLLGAGMAHYLGMFQKPMSFYLGLAWVLLVQAAASLLSGYHRPAAQLYQGDDENLRQRLNFRQVLLQVSAALLILSAGLTVLLAFIGYLNTFVVLFMGLVFFSLIIYAVPPVLLSQKGFGEILLAFHMSAFVPGLAFVMQTGSFHRILPVFTFPLTILALAYFLALNFRSFATDQKYARQTLLIRLGWQRGVPLHHVSILLTYILFSSAPLLGFPWAITWPVFLTAPLGLLEILWLNRIVLGARPVWNFLNALSASVFGLTVYILAITLWIR